MKSVLSCTTRVAASALLAHNNMTTSPSPLASSSLLLYSSSSPSPLSSLSLLSVLASPITISRRYRGPGDHPRTFAERAERREGRHRELRKEREALENIAEEYVRTEFNEELEHVHEPLWNKANVAALKITNMQKCLETIEIEAAGKKMPLLQVAQVIKISPTEIHILPQQTAFTSPILQRLMRFDSTITAQKEQQKIKVVLQPLTTARRDKAASEIKALFTELQTKVTKHLRPRAVRHLTDIGANNEVNQSLIKEMDEMIKAFIAEKEQEYEELEQSVMSVGLDESDSAVM